MISIRSINFSGGESWFGAVMDGYLAHVVLFLSRFAHGAESNTDASVRGWFGSGFIKEFLTATTAAAIQ